jgi:hypothetical protein
MYYAYDHERGRGKVYPLNVEVVSKIRNMNKQGDKPQDFAQFGAAITFEEPEEEIQFADVTGEIELPEEKKRRKKKKKKRSRGKNRGNRNQNRSQGDKSRDDRKGKGGGKRGGNRSKNRGNRNNNDNNQKN